MGLAALAALACSGIASGARTVVGGQTIQIQSAPWAVYVQHVSGGRRFICSGSVVDASHVLTAAHCLFDDAGTPSAVSSFQVRAGISSALQPLGSDVEQDRGVSSVRIHPGYGWSSHATEDDVAVLALASPLDLTTPAVQAVALPAAGFAYPTGEAVGVAGFGVQSAGTGQSGQLAWMTATVDPQGTCGGDDGTLFRGNGIFLCAGTPASALCNGDSGAGLVTTTGTPVLVGVVDASNGCGLGTHGVMAYTGAPEILQFVEGNDAPPAAPRDSGATFVRLTWGETKPPAVGETLTCATGGWSEPGTTVTYSFLNAATNQVLQSGAQATYVLQPGDAGAAVKCRVAVANAGGSVLAETAASSPVVAAPRAAVGHVVQIAAVRAVRAHLAVCLASVASRSCQSLLNARRG